MQQTIKDLVTISAYAGSRADYTQGGGGNTSVKNEKNGVMLIKASGYRLADITPTSAFVGIDKNKIASFYDNVDLSSGKDYEKESNELNKTAILPIDGIEVLRPSVEVGFHAVLKKYVIHTHSVYANILTCSKEGEEIANTLFKYQDFGFIFMSYINPGFELAYAMKLKIEEYLAKNGKYPEVIFMKNHGIVVNSDYLNRVIDLHTKVNEIIRNYFDLSDSFRAVELINDNGKYVSRTPILKMLLSSNDFGIELLNKYPLYPDQLVYLNNVLTFSPETVNVNGNKVIYNADLKKATTLEETLTAYLFVIDAIKKAGLSINTMNEKEVAFINNWEAEKYRRSVK